MRLATRRKGRARMGWWSNADGAIFLFGGAAQALDVARVIFVRSVGKIQAGNVHAQAKQVAHGCFGMAGWADGADDLGAAAGRNHVCRGGRRMVNRGETVGCEIGLASLHRLQSNKSWENYCNGLTFLFRAI